MGDAVTRIREACEQGGTSFYEAGINPGYTMDLWPLTLSRLSRRIDQLRAVEIVDMKDATSLQIMRDYIGFGLPPDHPTPLDEQLRVVEESAFYLSVRMIADALGVDLDEVTYRREVAVSGAPVPVASGVLDAGTVAAIRMTLDGIRDGEVLISLQYVWRMSDDVAPDWPSGASRWIVEIDGDPQVRSELELTTTSDAARAVSLAVATVNLNAVPAVCEAPPGPIDNLTIPPHAGGYFLPRGARRL